MLTVTVAPTTSDLTTTTVATRELKLGQADQNGLGELITQASAIVAAWCGRQPQGTTYSEFGAQTVRQQERLVEPAECIILDRDLNPAITSVVEGADTLTGSDYELDGSLLYRLEDDERTSWPAEKIVITYTTGWTLLAGLPPSIERAALIVVAQLVAARGENPMERRFDNGLVSVSYSDTDGGIPPAAAGLLAPWRRIRM